jgi:hypothetical protein
MNQLTDEQKLIDSALNHKTVRGVTMYSVSEADPGTTGLKIFFADNSALELKVGGVTAGGHPSLIVNHIPDVFVAEAEKKA